MVFSGCPEVFWPALCKELAKGRSQSLDWSRSSPLEYLEGLGKALTLTKPTWSGRSTLLPSHIHGELERVVRNFYTLNEAAEALEGLIKVVHLH